MDRPLRPHDLLWLKPGAAPEPESPLPPWAGPRLAQGLPLVVRRAPWAGGRIPVGLRGERRNQRLAAFLPSDGVARRVSPEELRGLAPAADRAELPAFRTLALLVGRLPPGLAWGPTGSAGFELASGCLAVTDGSDLDLLVRCPQPVSRTMARAWVEACSGLPARCDIQLETGLGGVALVEWAQGRAEVLLRTNAGPCLVGDPWLRALAAP